MTDAPPPTVAAGSSHPIPSPRRAAIPIGIQRWLSAFTALLVIGLAIDTVVRAGPHQFGNRRWGTEINHTDFTVYRLAGRAVLDETDIYQVRNDRGWAYVYPPPFAIAMVPFAGMSVFWGALIWYLLSAALIAWASLLCVRMVRNAGGADADPFTLTAIPLLLLMIWIMSGLTRGQASIAMFWLTMAAIHWQRAGRNILGAACLAGAVLLKVFPVALLGYFLWRKKWRFVTATIAAILVGAFVLPAAVFGWQKNIRYLKAWVREVAFPSVASESGRAENPLNEQLLSWGKPRNQSLPAVLFRLVGGPAARPLSAAISLGMLGAIWLVGRRLPPDSELLILSAFLVWLLLVPPVSESHYFLLLFLPLAELTAIALREVERKKPGMILVVLAAFVVSSVVALVFPRLQLYGQLCWASLLVWAALLAVATRAKAGPTSDP